MKFKNSMLSIFLCVTTVLLGFVVYSCKVGLGETVDTEPPKVYIENPKIKAVESNDIQVNGTWEDDKGISRIKIYVYNSDTNTQIIPSPEAGDSPVYAAIDGKNWSYTLFTTASDLSSRSAEVADLPVLSDGTYRLAVVAYDNIGHESATMERIFEVDNNPPVFVLSKPASLENNANPSAYGRKIEIKGVISDDHFNDFMQVRIFREDGTEIELAKSTFNKFDNSDTYVTVAQYYSDSELAKFGTDSEERKLHENYIRIYGQKGDEVFGTTQKYYAVITVKDSGENESKLAYLKTNLNKIISEAVNSLAAKDESSVEIIEDLKPFEFKDILKDSYSGNLSNAQRELVKTILNGNYDVSAAFANGEISKEYEYLAKDEQGHKLSFTVNSKANPTYQVLGFNLPEEPGKNSFGKTAKTGTLNLRVSSGLDGSEIYPNGITARIIKLDSNLNDPRNSDGRVIDENGNDVTDDYVIFIDGTKIYDINGNSIAENETAFSEPATFSINLTDFKDHLTAGRYYLVEVDGEDIKENEFLPSNDSKFGFFVELSSGAAKSVFEKNKEYVNAREFAQDDTFVLKISDDDTESNINVIAKTLIFKDKIVDTLSIDDFDEFDAEGNSRQEEVGYDYQFTDSILGLTGAKSYVKALKTNFKEYFDSIFNEETGKYDGDNFTIAIRVTLAKQEAATSNEIYYIFADNKAPGITLSNAELKKENWDKNGNIIVTDNQLKKTGELYYYTVNGLWNDLNGSGTSKVWYYFVDDISPDFVPPVNTKTDDDEAEDAANGWRRVSSVGAPETTKEMKLSEEFPLVSGEGKNKGIFFYATDKVGNKTELMQFKNIIFDYNAPTLTSSVVPEYYKQGDNAQITFKADDTNEICDIEIEIYEENQSQESGPLLTGAQSGLIAPADYAKKGITVSDFVIADDAKSGTKTITFTTDGTCDGKYKIKATSKDIANRTSATIEKTTIVDTTAPVLKDDKIQINTKDVDSTKFYNMTSLSVGGTYSDNNSVAYVYYYINNASKTEAVPTDLSATHDGFATLSTDGTGSFTFEPKTFKENAGASAINTLYIQAKDAAGNLSEIKSFEINIDTALPTITAQAAKAYYKKGEEASVIFNGEDSNQLKTIGVQIYKNNSETPLELTADSENANILKNNESGITLTVTDLGRVSSGSAGSAAPASTKSKMSAVVAFTTDGTCDGTYKLVGYATDIADQNSAANYEVTVTIDGTAPVFEAENFKVNSLAYSTGSYCDDKTVSLSGIYKDDTTGTKFLYYFVDWTGRNATIPESLIEDGNHDGVVNVNDNLFDFKTDKFAENRGEKKNTIYFQAEDKAGNLSTIESRVINVDESAPLLEAASVVQEYYTSGTPSITFNATDTNQVRKLSVEIYSKDKAGSITKTKVQKEDFAAKGINVTYEEPAYVQDPNNEGSTISKASVTITFTADGTHDGIFAATVTAEDSVGRTTKKEISEIIIDSIKPELSGNVKIGSKEYNPNSAAEEGAYFNQNTLRVEGNFTETTSGMSSYYYYIKAPDCTDATVPALDSKDSLGNGWTREDFKKDITTFSFTLSDLKDNITDPNTGNVIGNTLYIKAADNAGNLSDEVHFVINFDKTGPTVSSTPSEDEVQTYYSKKTNSESLEFILNAHDDIRIDSNCWIEFDFVRKNFDGTDPVKFDSDETYGGTFYDDNGIAISGSVSMDRKDLTSSIVIKTDGSGDGEYSVKARARDDAGNTSDVIKLNFTVDGTEPKFKNDLKIQNNEDWKTGNYYSSTTLKVTGTYEEKVSGIDTFYYYIAKPSVNAAGAVVPAEVLDENTLKTLDLSTKTGCEELTVKPGTTSLNFSDENFINNLEGQHSILYIQAKDQAGNLSEINKVEINVDTKAPEFTSTGLNEYYSKGKDAKVTFTATDVNKISSMDFVITKAGVTEPLEFVQDVQDSTKFTNAANGITLTKTAASRVADAQNSSSTVSTMQATITFTADGTHDGKFTINATATDIAGKKTVLEPLVTTIDGTEPVYTDGTLTIGGRAWNDDNSYYKNTTLKIAGAFAETPSGMDTVYYYVQYPNRTGDVPADLTPKGVADGDYNFKSGENAFSINVEQFAENAGGIGNTLYIQGVDKAGNKSEIKSFDINIDPSEAELSVVLYRIEGTNLNSPSGTVYANGTKAIAICGNYEDAQSGIRPLEFTLGGNVLTPDDVNYSVEKIAWETDEEKSACIDKLNQHGSDRPKEGQNDFWMTYEQLKDKNIEPQDVKSWRVLFTPDSEHSGALSIFGYNGTYIKDQNGGKTTISPFRIELDEEAPKINNIRVLKVSGEKSTDVYSKTINENGEDKLKYYINNANDTNLTISGVSTDNFGVDKVSLEITGQKKSDGTTEKITKENKGTAQVWRFEEINLSSIVTNATAKVIATDISGNTAEHTIEILFDTKSPESVHAVDVKQKDLYFRIGEFDNDDITPATASNYFYKTKDSSGNDKYEAIVWNDDLDKDVGGKYSNGTYGNAKTIRIRGNFGDGTTVNDSGVKMIYYRVFSQNEIQTSESELTAEQIAKVKNLSDYTGYFAPLSVPEHKRVFYNVAPKGTDETDEDFAKRTFGGNCLMKKNPDNPAEYIPVESKGYYKYFKDVEVTYDSTLNGFVEGNNYVVIVAQDNVGNTATSSIKIGEDSYDQITLNVDTVAPTITEITDKDFTKNHIVNSEGKGEGDKLLTISGKVQDEKAGVKSFKIKVNETYIPATNIKFDAVETDGVTTYSDELTVDALEHTWYATIPANIINSQTGAIAVYAEAVDNAGTGQEVSRKVASIQLDTTPPSARVTSTAGWIKDKIENVSVYVNDTNGIKKNASDKEEISYNVYASTDSEYATSLASGNALVGSDGTATVATISTSDGTKFVDGKSYIVRFTATDIVGNTSYVNSDPYTVDRTMPAIKADESGVDSVLTKDEVDKKWFMSETLSVAGKFTDKAGELTEGCGVKTVYYALYNKALADISSEDTPITGSWSTTDGTYSGNVSGFKSGTNTLRIWAEDKLGNSTENAPVIYTVRLDMTGPTIKSNLSAEDSIISSNGGTAITVINGTVEDADSGVRDVKIKVDGNPTLIDAEPKKVSTVAGEKDWSEGWTVTIPTSYLTEGTLPVQAIATDKAGEQGNSTTVSVATINIDKTPPVIKIDTSSLKDADANQSGIQVNGEIQISGTAKDSNGLKKEEENGKTLKLYYTTLAQTDTITTYGTEENPSTVPTKITISSDASTAWKVISQSAHDSSWSFTLDTTIISPDVEAKPVYLIVEGYDAAGNIGYSTPEQIVIDQDTDRPIITLTSPSEIDMSPDNGNDGYVTWENGTINGTVSDDDGVTWIGYYVGKESDIYKTEDSEGNPWYEEITISNGIWKISDIDEGPDNVFFKVIAGGKNYYANISTTYNAATIYNKTDSDQEKWRGTYKLTDGTHKYAYRNENPENTTTTKGILNLIVDTTAPDVETAEYSINKSPVETDGVITWEDTSNIWKTGIGSQTFGGKKNKLKIRQNAWDRNVVKQMNVKVIKTVTQNGIDTVTYPFDETYKYTDTPSPVEVQRQVGIETRTYLCYTSGEIDISEYESSSDNVKYRIEIEMSDGIKTTVSKLDLTIDNTKPNVTFSGPDSNGIHSGEITVYGNATEIGTISYTVSTDGVHAPSTSAGQTLSSWTGYKFINEQKTAKTDTITSISVPDYTIIPNANLAWTVNFDGNTTETQRAHANYLKSYIQSLGISNNLATFTDLVNFYVWIKAEDKVGNCAEYPHLVCIDPQGDRPSVTLSNPEEPNATSGVASLGGTIKLYGTAEDSNGTVESVWVQLLSAKNGTNYGAVTKNDSNQITAFEPTANDVTFWLTNNYPVYYVADNAVPVELKLSTNTSNTTATVFNSSTHTPTKCFIKATFSGSAWNLKINTAGEFNPDENATEANGMAVRVYARDNDKNLSYSVTRYFKVDKDTPVISNVMLRQYASTDTNFATSLASQDVRAGMYVKGSWYLEFTVTDNDSIESIEFDGISADSADQIKADNISDVTVSSGVSKKVRIPLSSTSASEFRRTIKAYDRLNHPGSYEIEIYFDNDPPKLLKGTAADFDIEASVQQSNGFYKLYSKVNDENSTSRSSGVKAVGFYFMRRDSDGKGNIYDPMQQRAAPISTDNLTYVDGLYWLNGSVTCNSDGSITLGTGLSEKVDYVHAGSYIRLGGVMYKITNKSGTTVMIEEDHATGSNISAQIALAQFVDNRKAEYEASTTKSTTGYYTSIKNDDGDNIIEELGGTKTVSTWQGAIVSRNIPDGPIEIHYTAYDESMNYAVGVVGNKDQETYENYPTPEVNEIKGKTLVTDGQYASYVYTYNSDNPAYISNNAPRLAGVTVAIDYTGSGNYNTASKTSYYYMTETRLINNQAQIKPIAVTNNLVISEEIKNDNEIVIGHKGVNTIKGKTWIIPEMVGGNGKLWYTYNIYSSGTNGAKSTTVKKSSETTATYFADGNEDYDVYVKKAGGQDYVDSHSTAGYIVHDTSIFTGEEGTGDATVDSPLWFDYTIYDSTETPDLTDGTTASTNLTNNQKATISIAMAVEVNDNVSPNVVFNDLYWNDKTDNSVYWVDGNAQGHVELRSDLVDGEGKIGGVYGMDDDKVSGIVKFTGYAWDNKCLSELKWAIVPHGETYTATSLTHNFGSDWQKGATFDTATGNWTSSATMDDNHYTFEVSKESSDGAYHDKNGHKVKWTLTVDTAHIDSVVAEDMRVIVQAIDTASQSSAITNVPTTSTANQASDPATYDKETSRPTYKVDVVPYITGIETMLSTLKQNNPSVYSRTALGHYPVRTGETITFIGFNLGTNTTLSINDEVSSGKYTFKNGDFIAINNLNKNDARGSYKGIVDLSANPTGDETIYSNYYNRQPNGDNNNLLTDDIWLDVWDIDSTAVYPMRQKGSIAQAVMKINPVTDQLGFAFANAAAYFSMPGKTAEAANDDSNNTWDGNNVVSFSPLRDYSYTYWNGELEPFTSVGFTYDKYGYSYGVASGGDINSGTGDTIDYYSFMTDRWGKALGATDGGDDYARHKSSKHAQNSVRLETNGLKIGGASVFETKRIKSSSIVASAHGDNNLSSDTNIYLAYFDVLNSEIRFRAGNIGEKDDTIHNILDKNNNNWGEYNITEYYKLTKLEKSSTTGKSFYYIDKTPYWNLTDGNRVKIYTDDDSGNKILVDEYKETEFIIYNLNLKDASNRKFVLLTSDSNKTSEPYPLYDSTTATKLREGTYYIKTVSDKSKGFFGNFTDTFTQANKTPSDDKTNVGIIAKETTAGEYLSMGVIPKGSTGGQSSDDVLVIVWYGDDMKLHYAYNTTPSTIRGNGSTEGWTSSTLFTGDLAQAGEYCQLAVDANGGIHIAVLDSSNSDLVYAYIEKYNEPEKVKTCIVDSSGIVGDYLTIDVALKEGKAVPQISYYNSSTKRPKLAYLVNTDFYAANTQSTIVDGAKKDLFTGTWESTVIPTSSKIDLSDNGNKINVGVWKDDSGNVKNSTPLSKLQSKDHVNNYYSTSYGIIGGNGTANAVLGYIVKKDSTTNTIETAQMK